VGIFINPNANPTTELTFILTLNLTEEINKHLLTRLCRPRYRGDNTFRSVRVCACVCVSVGLSVGALLFEPFDLLPWFLA